MVGGVTLGLFSLGMFVPWANAKGAITGAVSSLVIVLWIGLGAQVAVLNGQIHLNSKPVSIDACPCVNSTTVTSSYLGDHDDEVSSIYKVLAMFFAWADKPLSVMRYYLRVNYHSTRSQISYLWYSVIGCVLTTFIGVVVSFFTGFQDPRELDQDLLSPPIASLFRLQTKPQANNIQGITNFGLELDDEKSQVDGVKSPMK